MTTTQIDRPHDRQEARERFDTIVIGGGQAGLTAGYHLKRRGVPFVILDKHERIGDAWRTRWDSLRLFTPANYAGLPGWRFPAPASSFPTKDELADYLEAYAARFELDVRNGVSVARLSKSGDRFVVEAEDTVYEADHVIVATGAHRTPKVPGFARELDPRIVQLHSSEYRSPAQLRDGRRPARRCGQLGRRDRLRVVDGAPHVARRARRGTGAGPAREPSVAALLPDRRLRLPPRAVEREPDRPQGRPEARKPRCPAHPAPAKRPGRGRHRAATSGRRGCATGSRCSRTTECSRPANVVWCTGFRQDFSWIDLPVFGGDGLPEHKRGVVTAEPGLYFLGLVFQHSFASDVLPDRGRDAGYIAKHLAKRVRVS